MVHCISLLAGDRLRRLAERFELVWASGWEDKANYYLPQHPRPAGAAALDLRRRRPLSAPRTGSSARSRAYCRGRAMAWIDDNFDESCYEWARAAAGADPAGADRAAPRPRGGARPKRSRPGRFRWADGASATLTPVTGFWPIFFLLVVLKIPVLGSLWLVWWASQAARRAGGSAEDAGGGFKRRAAAEAAARPAARAPWRRRRGAAAGLPAGRPHPGRQAGCAAGFRSRRISRR